MVNLFPNDSYDTPPGRRTFLSRILFNSRLYFYSKTYYNFYRIGRCAGRGRFDRDRQSYYSGLNVRILESCGARIHLRGLNHLSGTPGPFVIVANHQSSVETAILNAVISPRLDFTFVIKRSLFSVPFFGAAMRAIDAIGVDRVNPREDFKEVMRAGQELLKGGRSVLIFPESTRQREFLPERFNTIGLKLAKSAGVRIIPLALKTDFLEPGALIPEFGSLHRSRHIHLEFGEPLEASGNGREAHRQILDFIAERTAHWNLAERRASCASAGLNGFRPAPVS